MRTIGFAGTAKNTGKTTTIQAVIKQAHQSCFKIALTSIGVDPEYSNGQSPARITLEIDDLIATASDCLKTGSAVLDIIETTPIETTLGLVVIARVTTAGTVYAAGVNREKDLKDLAVKFATLGVDLLMVDGALNRMVPMIACDGLVLSSGAAFDQDIHKIAEHAAALVHLFDPELSQLPQHSDQKISLTFSDESVVQPNSGSLISSRTLDEITPLLVKPLVRIEIPGACHPMLLKMLLEKEALQKTPINLIFGNPLKLIASGGLNQWVEFLQNQHLTIHYRRTLPVKMLTLNPFYLKPRPGTTNFQNAYVDKYFLLRSVRILLPDFTVYDLMQLPQPDLMRLLDVNKPNP